MTAPQPRQGCDYVLEISGYEDRHLVSGVHAAQGIKPAPQPQSHKPAKRSAMFALCCGGSSHDAAAEHASNPAESAVRKHTPPPAPVHVTLRAAVSHSPLKAPTASPEPGSCKDSEASPPIAAVAPPQSDSPTRLSPGSFIMLPHDSPDRAADQPPPLPQPMVYRPTVSPPALAPQRPQLDDSALPAARLPPRAHHRSADPHVKSAPYLVPLTSLRQRADSPPLQPAPPLPPALQQTPPRVPRDRSGNRTAKSEGYKSDGVKSDGSRAADSDFPVAIASLDRWAIDDPGSTKGKQQNAPPLSTSAERSAWVAELRRSVERTQAALAGGRSLPSDGGAAESERSGSMGSNVALPPPPPPDTLRPQQLSDDNTVVIHDDDEWQRPAALVGRADRSTAGAAGSGEHASVEESDDSSLEQYMYRKEGSIARSGSANSAGAVDPEAPLQASAYTDYTVGMSASLYDDDGADYDGVGARWTPGNNLQPGLEPLPAGALHRRSASGRGSSRRLEPIEADSAVSEELPPGAVIRGRDVVLDSYRHVAPGVNLGPKRGSFPPEDAAQGSMPPPRWTPHKEERLRGDAVAAAALTSGARAETYDKDERPGAGHRQGATHEDAAARPPYEQAGAEQLPPGAVILGRDSVVDSFRHPNPVTDDLFDCDNATTWSLSEADPHSRSFMRDSTSSPLRPAYAPRYAGTAVSVAISDVSDDWALSQVGTTADASGFSSVLHGAPRDRAEFAGGGHSTARLDQGDSLRFGDSTWAFSDVEQQAPDSTAISNFTTTVAPEVPLRLQHGLREVEALPQTLRQMHQTAPGQRLQSRQPSALRPDASDSAAAGGGLRARFQGSYEPPPGGNVDAGQRAGGPRPTGQPLEGGSRGDAEAYNRRFPSSGEASAGIGRLPPAKSDRVGSWVSNYNSEVVRRITAQKAGGM